MTVPVSGGEARAGRGAGGEAGPGTGSGTPKKIADAGDGSAATAGGAGQLAADGREGWAGEGGPLRAQAAPALSNVVSERPAGSAVQGSGGTWPEHAKM